MSSARRTAALVLALAAPACTRDVDLRKRDGDVDAGPDECAGDAPPDGCADAGPDDTGDGAGS